MERTRDNTLVLFDVDGTLALAMKEASPEMKEYLKALQKKVTVGIVGGSNVQKQQKQLGESAIIDVKAYSCEHTATYDYDYVFPENGLVAFKNGKQFHEMEFKKYLTEEQLKELINFILHYIADLDIPMKRGTFVEFRTGMLNVSPIGRNCTYDERLAFNAYDQEHKIRENFVKALKKRFSSFNLRFSIGGQISMDIFPEGWDKTYCLRHVADRQFKEIHFWGDKTFEGGNDFEIFSSPETIGHATSGPEETLKQLKEIFGE